MKKNLVIPIAIAVLSIGFVIVSLLVIATKGNNAFFVSKKLKIGGLILAMTVMFYACSSGEDVGQNNVLCYSTNDIDNNDFYDTDDNENNTSDNTNNNNDNSSDNTNNNINSDDKGNGINEDVIMCYKVSMSSHVSIYNSFEDGFIKLNLSEDNIIKGEVSYFRDGSKFSYALREATENFQEIGKTYQSGNIKSKDINTTKGYEEFEIILDQDLEAGNYHLFFYEFAVEKIEDNPSDFLNAFNIKITK